MSQTVDNCPVSQYRRILQKFLDPDFEADSFQHLISFSVSTDTSLLNVHEDTISSFAQSC